MRISGSMVNYEGLYRHYIKRFKLTQSGKQAVGLCPFHDDKNPSFSMNLDTGLYCCHGCDVKGNAYYFAKTMKHPTPSRWIDDGHNQSPYPKNGKRATEIDLWNKAKEYQKNLTADWIKESKRAMGMLVGEDKQGRLTFPYFDEDGDVVGIKHHKGKNGESPYWEGDGACKWYGLHLLKGFDRNKPLYICEGEKDCLRMLSLGYQTTCGSAGSGGIPKDFNPIVGFAEYMNIFDNDNAGKVGVKKLAERLFIEV